MRERQTVKERYRHRSRETDSEREIQTEAG